MSGGFLADCARENMDFLTPFGGLKKCRFSGKRQPLCRPDAPERKNYERRFFLMIVVGKPSNF